MRYSAAIRTYFSSGLLAVLVNTETSNRCNPHCYDGPHERHYKRSGVLVPAMMGIMHIPGPEPGCSGEVPNGEHILIPIHCGVLLDIRIITCMRCISIISRNCLDISSQLMNNTGQQQFSALILCILKSEI